MYLNVGVICLNIQAGDLNIQVCQPECSGANTCYHLDATLWLLRLLQ